MAKRPTHTFSDPGVIQPQSPKPLWNPEFDPEGFDELIRNRGLRWKHERAAFCPNVRDIDSLLHDANCKECDNGFIYYGCKTVLGIFSNNKLEKMYEIQGSWDIGEAVVTFTSYQPDAAGNPGKGEMNDFQFNDKVTCLDYTFTWTQLIEHNPIGLDRLRYEAVDIELIRDRNRVYAKNVDYIIESGQVRWISGNRPTHQLSIARGGIYTIVYSANPIFYVTQILHEIRATKGVPRGEDVVTAIRLPQQCVIRRDYLPKRNDGSNSPAPRDNQVPPE